jgi:hypothetical protein
MEIGGLVQLCRDRAWIVPVIISPCEWDRHEWLRSRQFLPRGVHGAADTTPAFLT